MIDFNKKIINSNKFREPAITFQQTGRYCNYASNTSEYFTYWDEQKRRCLDGYTADDGDYISGYNYFYLNFCPINRSVNKMITDRFGKSKVVAVQEVAFPDFWDYDYYYFQAVQNAEESGKHLCVLKSRRKGYSYKNAAMLCRNYYLIPDSKSYVYASNKQYLTDDGILTKAWDYMDFIDKNTAWGKKRSVNTSMRKRAGFFTKDEFGNEVELGYKSEIIGVTLKDNPDVVRGKKAKLILFEEAGSFKELGAAWQIARPSVEVDGVAFGTMVAFGTGGDQDSNFATLKDMFYKPKGYNCIELPNIWDENAVNSTCGFFIPQYTNMDIRDEKGNRIYMDDDGNTLRKPSLDFILNQRKEMIQNATNSVAIDRYVCERCITPSEACLEFGGNIFPKKELQEQLALLRSNKQLQNHKQIGDLIQTPDGNISWRIKKTGDITHYPLNKDDDPTGSIVIWEHPMKDAPFGLYIAGCLTPGQKVLTDKGLVNVEDVDFSYKLINRNGDFSKIINLQRYEKINEPIFTIKPAGSYRTTTFTQEHPILLNNNEFVKAKDLAKGDELVIPNRYNKVSNEYIHILKNELNIEGNNLLFWRFIGLWLGDGFNNVNKKSHDVYMAFGKNQKYEADEYSVLIDKVFNRKTIWCKSNGGQTRRFTHKDLVLFLDKHFGKYAKYKKIPEWVKYIPKDCKQSLICGYLDSDGTILKDRNRYKISFTSINLELLESFQQILYSIDICSSITLKSKQGDYVIKDRIQHKQDSYLLQVSYFDVKKFKQFDCSCCIKLKRLIDYTEPLIKKKNRMTRISDDGKYIYLKIKDIQQNRYTGTVYNFECETHTYMCHDIVTHNCDPYDHDQSGTNSLGSCFIYKRIQNLESYSDIIVAEYTGRPNSADDFYENVRKLLLYYNARMMYENQNKGIFVYFANKHCDYLLADQPDIINDIVGGSKVQRKKGCHMNKQIKAWGEGLIKDWLNDINANGKKNLYNILSEPLLEELIAYNDIINTDRVMSLMQIMIYREQLYNVVVKEKEKENKSRLLFDGPIFAQNWFNDDSPVKFNDDNVYTFSN